RCSCCTISRGTGTRRSPTCWGSWPARRNRSCIMPVWRSASISSAEGAGTMKDQWTDRLSEYLDGEISGPERTTLEAHVASCDACRTRSEEHTSELQSRFDLVCRLLLEKKKKKNTHNINTRSLYSIRQSIQHLS